MVKCWQSMGEKVQHVKRSKKERQVVVFTENCQTRGPVIDFMNPRTGSLIAFYKDDIYLPLQKDGKLFLLSRLHRKGNNC
jgi:hypothetical protein